MLQIELVPITAIRPYEHNAKIHTAEQIEQIKKSILEFGNNDPIAIDGEGVIIEGHGRLMALQELGYTEVEVIRLGHLTEEQRKAYTLVHNKLTMNTGFDLEILATELQAIENINMADYDFELDILTDLVMDDPEEDDFEPEIDEAAEPIAKLGDIWKLGNHRLMCGDSTDRKCVEKLMDGEQAELAFTDPPWNVNYGAVKEGNAQGYKPRTILNDFMGTGEFKEFMNKAFACLNLAQKDGAMTYVVMSAQEWAI